MQSATIDIMSDYTPYSRRRRGAVIILLILAVTVWHWATPMTPVWMHAVHIVLRKLFFLPIILAAIWFGVSAAVYAAGAVSIIYVPYVFFAWSGIVTENFNQIGEVLMLWVVGMLAGWLASRERRALEDTARMSGDALNALVAALDAREHQTEQHSHRVASLATRVGRRMGMHPLEIETLRQASILHDVGKIGVPDDILLKAGPLTVDERQTMQEHARMGYNILKAASHLDDVAELVLAHHERFDGSGYPNGLVGESIPLGARVFAVADVYDALTNDRPYREALSMEEALEYIRNQSSHSFDPQVVSMMLSELRTIQPSGSISNGP